MTVLNMIHKKMVDGSWKRASAFLALAGLLVADSTTAFAAAEADLLVAYDASHASSVGGEDNAQVLAANAVAGCNSVNDRSGTGARVRICGYYQAAQNLYQTTSKGGFVNWMATYDAHMTDVVDAGNARGADLVAWICVSTADGAAAVAQQPGRYSAFDPGSFWSAVIAHELGGHNYGCDHRGGKGDLASPKTVLMHNYCTGGGSTPPYLYSNPNLWLNGVRLLGIGSCLGTAVNGGDNAYLISTACQGVADSYGRVVVAPNLTNVVLRWCFTNAVASAPASTTNFDLISGAPAVVRGVGAIYTGKGLRIPGGTTGNTAANSIAAYIDLPNGIISSRTNLTIEIWATPLSAPNWGRIADFGRTTEAGNGAAGEWTGVPGSAAPGSTSSSDDIMLSASIGTDINQQRFEAKLNGTATTLDAGLATTAGVPHHYAITFTDGAGAAGAAGGRWQWFRDGDAIAYLDVTNHLAVIEDVNNWLGRSLWSADSMANIEYAEVRISNVAMTRDQIFANYTLGPNRFASTVTLSADDAIGSASFAAAGNWSDGLAPSAAKTYETYRFRLRTPADATSRTFAGQALNVDGGSITWKGTTSSTLTITNLTLSGSPEFVQAGSGTWTLAGNLTVKSDEAMMRAANGPITISANVSGSGNLLHVNNTVTLSGNNTNFTGKTIVGDGRFGGLSIDSEARLGANPTNFVADQLTLNRGVLYSGNMTISNSNRGIRIGVSAGIFNVSAGTTLTVGVPLSSSGSALVTTPQYPNPVSGMLIKENSGTLVLTNPNNSHAGEVVINGGGLTVGGAGRLNNGDQAMPVVNNGTLTFGTTANQTNSGAISGAGALIKTNSGTLTISGANTMSGSVTINGGVLYANTANAATNRAFSYVSGITINSGGTLRASANALFGWDGTQEKPITVNPGGTLTANGGLTSDVGVGTVTLAGGTLATLAGGATDYGSWRFDNAGDKLAATQDSTASALNVKFANGAVIDVAATKTLNFTGTITDSSGGGASSVVKSGGAGTLTLAGVNTYTGSTAISNGTLLVNGSIGSGAVTITTGATLGGNGTVNGATTVNSGGTLSPGSGIGKLTVSSSVALQSGSTTLMEISKSPQTNDQLRVTGVLSLGGTLTVTNLSGTLAANDSFQLFNAGSTSGAFTATNLPPLDAGLGWIFNSTSGTLTVVQTVATNSTNISFTVIGNNLTLTWPSDHTGWRLQVQTNLPNAGLGTNWVDVSASTLTNMMVMPVDATAGNVFYRLVY
jgi:autotransporter-associated beta strand protein